MIHTPSLLIVTADAFPLSANADTSCGALVKAAGCGKHLYGGKHYGGHHVVFRKWEVAKSLRAHKAIAMIGA